MKKEILYCLYNTTDYCYSLSEWGVIWQSVGVFASIAIGLVGFYKIYLELKELNRQRAKQLKDDEDTAKLTRTEFFLRQHRRLFDDFELSQVMNLIDSDDIRLRNEKLWDSKRKLLVFFEEVALLVYSGQLNKEVAFYMFGYYVRCAVHGENFAIGIEPSREHWGLLYRFVDDLEEHLLLHSEDPPKNLNL
ncbi:hypothetical protein [Aeromonas hydrophila]|uniref:hypothetical protein n=1 Tax=Aeromonas hydrophila TaxID=644 RepID=UPI003EC6F5B1